MIFLFIILNFYTNYLLRQYSNYFYSLTFLLKIFFLLFLVIYILFLSIILTIYTIILIMRYKKYLKYLISAIIPKNIDYTYLFFI